MKKCPFCAEEVQDDAVKCKHCGGKLIIGRISILGLFSSVLIFIVFSWTAFFLSLNPNLSTRIVAFQWSKVTTIFFVLGMIGIYVSRKQIRNSKGHLSGLGITTVAIVLGWLAFAALNLLYFIPLLLETVIR